MNGYDRIKEQYLKLETKEDALKKIMLVLMKTPNMNDLYLNEEKNINEMMKYIKDNAKEKAVNNVAVIEDAEVYEWAIKYFSKSNDELGITKLSNATSVTSKKNKENKDNSNSQLKLELECT